MLSVISVLSCVGDALFLHFSRLRCSVYIVSIYFPAKILYNE